MLLSILLQPGDPLRDSFFVIAIFLSELFLGKLVSVIVILTF